MIEVEYPLASLDKDVDRMISTNLTNAWLFAPIALLVLG